MRKNWRICSWQTFPALSNVCGYDQEPILEWSSSGRRETIKTNKGNVDGVKSHDSVFCSVENSHFRWEKFVEKNLSLLCRKFSFLWERFGEKILHALPKILIYLRIVFLGRISVSFAMSKILTFVKKELWKIILCSVKILKLLKKKNREIILFCRYFILLRKVWGFFCFVENSILVRKNRIFVFVTSVDKT